MDETRAKSLSRALDILDCYSVERPELGVSEIARMLQVSKSNVHNTLAAFERHGYLQKDRATSKYRLGLTILKLANIIGSNLDERDVILPHIKQIANESGEMVYYGIIHGTSVLYLDYACTSGSIIERSRMGVTAPLYCTSTGKAMMAYLPASEQERIIAAGFKRFTENTIGSREEMLAEISRIRERGYSIDNMEHEFGVKGVGIAIFNKDGYPVAGISVSGPSLRFEEERIEFFAELLRKHRELVAAQL